MDFSGKLLVGISFNLDDGKAGKLFKRVRTCGVLLGNSELVKIT